jgi:hypothetical protein
MRLNAFACAKTAHTGTERESMETTGSAWAYHARPILTKRDYDAVQSLVADAAAEQPRTLALQRELADYDSRGGPLSALAAWAEWVFVPRWEPGEQPKRRWTDASLGLFGSLAAR